jgi:glycosyltransferase involved in cell wall biosynthesis
VRIAQIVPRGEQPWSGVLTVLVHLAAGLAERGHDVEVWQFHEWPPRDYAEQRRVLNAAGVVEVPMPEGRQSRNAAALAERRGIDVVHLHGAFNVTNTLVSRSIRRPYVFSPHSGYDPVSLRRHRARKVLYRVLFERAMLERASLLVALTDAELADVRRFGASAPAVVIPNGVERPPADLDRGAFRRELRIGSDDLLAVFVGRLDVYRKGLDVLVRGIAAAPGCHLALIGPRFRDVDRLEALIEQLGIGARIHLLGERHGRGLQQSVAGADLFTMLSRWEGMPMALLEALSLSVPAIVSPVVERAIGVDAAGAGWVAEEQDLGPLLSRLRDADRRELRRRGEAAVLLSGRYGWAEVAERYEHVYERALPPGRRVPL